MLVLRHLTAEPGFHMGPEDSNSHPLASTSVFTYSLIEGAFLLNGYFKTTGVIYEAVGVAQR